MPLRLPITDGCFYNPILKFAALWCSWLTRCLAVIKNMSLAFVLAHEAEIRRAVAGGASKRSIFKRLKCNNETLDRALLILGIDYKGNQGGKGYKLVTNKKPLTQFLKSGSGATIKRLKPRLIEEGLKRARCESCLRKTWQGQLIPLDLHHKNGDPKDNRLRNLELLCPNCH